ncbi:Uncharacterised protein [Mycobacteroides abscessus subsp. abscessus]|nr:Uncharacterised protein [Mycobacteroides abscessus subsp. abscessus]SLH59824.1 Uncharacterised protein [Mycobacteroides abscessus subsp. abscessus]SLH80502.1 Uncharacterised protein [Mycobacteroides abscessus subsp. abscessus]
MSDTEPPLTLIERLVIVSLYARLTVSAPHTLPSPAARLVSQNRSVPGRLSSERSCYSDLNICSPTTLSHEEVPVSRSSEGFRAC